MENIMDLVMEEAMVAVSGVVAVGVGNGRYMHSLLKRFR